MPWDQLWLHGKLDPWNPDKLLSFHCSNVPTRKLMFHLRIPRKVCPRSPSRFQLLRLVARRQSPKALKMFHPSLFHDCSMIHRLGPKAQEELPSSQLGLEWNALDLLTGWLKRMDLEPPLWYCLWGIPRVPRPTDNVERGTGTSFG